MSILALITARGGSKGIPRKNLRLVGGKSLLAWTIDAARGSQFLERVMLSTDDEAIATAGKQLGAEVPFMRPPELAQDSSDHLSVALHVLDWLEQHEGAAPEYVMLLQPTSPLRTTEDIDNVIQIAREHQASAVVSVCEAAHHPYLTKRIAPDGTLVDFMSADIPYLRRQDLPAVYALNGAIYLNRPGDLRRDRTFIPSGTFPYIMPLERSMDIDTEWDLHVVDLILRDKQAAL